MLADDFGRLSIYIQNFFLERESPDFQMLFLLLILM